MPRPPPPRPVPRRRTSRPRTPPASPRAPAAGTAASAPSAPRPVQSDGAWARIRRSRAKNSRCALYSTAITTSQAGAISSAKRVNDRSRLVQREQRGQVGDGQQQAGGVGEAYAGRQRRPGTYAGPLGRGQDDRRQQHHRRVEAEHGGDCHRRQERQAEEPRARGAPTPDPLPDRAEETEVGAGTRDHQDRGQERHDREQLPHGVTGLADRGRTGDQAGADGGQCDHGLVQATEVPERDHEQGDQRQQGHRVARRGMGEGGGHCASLGTAAPRPAVRGPAGWIHDHCTAGEALGGTSVPPTGWSARWCSSWCSWAGSSGSRRSAATTTSSRRGPSTTARWPSRRGRRGRCSCSRPTRCPRGGARRA